MSKIKCLAIMLAVCILNLLVFIGSSDAAASLATTEQISTKSSNSSAQSNAIAIGFVDVSRIMAESPIVKSFQNELNQKGKELSDQLVIEESNLTAEQFKQRQNALYQEFLELKDNLEKQIDESVKQAAIVVVKEKKLDFVIYKNSDNEKIPPDSVDITSDVIDKMQVINR
jgi:outer membrane protein